MNETEVAQHLKDNAGSKARLEQWSDSASNPTLEYNPEDNKFYIERTSIVGDKRSKFEIDINSAKLIGNWDLVD